MSTINKPDKFTQPKPRTEIRLALPSKGRMEEETRTFLHACGLAVNKVNPRQYIAQIDDIPYLEIWFQRSADVVRKVRDGDVDLGIVGFDMVVEYRGGGDDVVIIHDALGYGQCHLSVAVPEDWANVHSTRDLAAMAASRQARRPAPGGQYSARQPLFGTAAPDQALPRAPRRRRAGRPPQMGFRRLHRGSWSAAA